MTEIYIKIDNRFERLDTNNINLDIIMSLIDILDNSKSQSYSKSFDLEATDRNNRLLKFKYDINIIDNNTIEYDCFVNRDSVRILEGILKINNIDNNNGVITYKCNINSKVQPFFKLLDGINISDIDWSDCDTIYNDEILENNYRNFVRGTGVIYPLIDYNYNFLSNKIANITTDDKTFVDNWRVLKPAIYLTKLNDKIFKHLNIDYKSNFFNNTVKDVVFTYVGENNRLISSKYYEQVINNFDIISELYTPNFGNADLTTNTAYPDCPGYMFTQQYSTSTDNRATSSLVYVYNLEDKKRDLVSYSTTDYLYKYKNEEYLNVTYNSVIDKVYIELEFTLNKEFFTDDNDSAIFIKFNKHGQRLEENDYKLTNYTEALFNKCDFFHLSDAKSTIGCDNDVTKGYLLYLHKNLTKNNNSKINYNNISTIINESNRDLYKIYEDSNIVTYKIQLETDQFESNTNEEFGLIFNYIAKVNYLKNLKSNEPSLSPFTINKMTMKGYPHPNYNKDASYVSAESIFGDIKIIDIYKNIFKLFNLIVYYDYNESVYIIEDYNTFMKNSNIINLSKQIDKNSISIQKNLNKNIRLDYSKSDTILTNKYINDYNYNYGSLHINNDINNLTNLYEINTIFESNLTTKSFISFEYPENPLPEPFQNYFYGDVRYINLKNDNINILAGSDVDDEWYVPKKHIMLVNVNNINSRGSEISATKTMFETSMSKLKDEQINLLFNDDSEDNLYRRFHKDYIELFNSDDSMLVTCKIHLTPNEFSKINYNTIIRLDNIDSSSSSNLFYINKLTYNPASELQTFELIKINNINIKYDNNIYRVDDIDLNNTLVKINFNELVSDASYENPFGDYTPQYPFHNTHIYDVKIEHIYEYFGAPIPLSTATISFSSFTNYTSDYVDNITGTGYVQYPSANGVLLKDKYILFEGFPYDECTTIKLNRLTIHYLNYVGGVLDYDVDLEVEIGCDDWSVVVTDLEYTDITSYNALSPNLTVWIYIDPYYEYLRSSDEKIWIKITNKKDSEFVIERMYFNTNETFDCEVNNTNTQYVIENGLGLKLHNEYLDSTSSTVSYTNETNISPPQLNYTIIKDDDEYISYNLEKDKLNNHFLYMLNNINNNSIKVIQIDDDIYIKSLRGDVELTFAYVPNNTFDFGLISPSNPNDLIIVEGVTASYENEFDTTSCKIDLQYNIDLKFEVNKNNKWVDVTNEVVNNRWEAVNTSDVYTKWRTKDINDNIIQYGNIIKINY